MSTQCSIPRPGLRRCKIVAAVLLVQVATIGCIDRTKERASEPVQRGLYKIEIKSTRKGIPMRYPNMPDPEAMQLFDGTGNFLLNPVRWHQVGDTLYLRSKSDFSPISTVEYVKKVDGEYQIRMKHSQDVLTLIDNSDKPIYSLYLFEKFEK